MSGDGVPGASGGGVSAGADGDGAPRASERRAVVRGDVLPLEPAAVLELTRLTAAGGVACFPAEGVYGLAADPGRPEAVARMVALKGRDPGKPSALMFWDPDAARDAAAPAGEAVQEAMGRLLPGPVGVLVPGAAGAHAAAAGPDGTLGIRVPRLPGPVDAPPVLQTSANLAGGPDALVLADVPAAIRAGCGLVLDGGRRTGAASTIVDLRGLATAAGTWRIVREGAVPAEAVRAALDGLGRAAAGAAGPPERLTGGVAGPSGCPDRRSGRTAGAAEPPEPRAVEAAAAPARPRRRPRSTMGRCGSPSPPTTPGSP